MTKIVKGFLRAIMILSMAHTYAEQGALAPDPNLSVEVLPNGMSIAVYPNSEPPGRVSMRLLVRRGSACENADELGLAHFTEHMAFNGTTRFPSGDMVEYFQRLGMAFGADTNAHTGFNETVYKLDIPDVSEKLLEDGMMLLRDYADGILFEEKAINSERGVIVAEKDSRDTPDYRKYVAEISHYYKGSIYPKRLPIGDMNVVKNATRKSFVNFYKSTYRPENMVLVVVGDVDAKQIAKLAKKYFESFKSDAAWKNRIVDFGKLESGGKNFSFAQTQMDFDSASMPIANASSGYAAVAVSRQIDGQKDSFSRRVRQMRLRVLTTAINARYMRVSDAPGSKISSGSSASFDLDTYAETFMLGADSPVGGHADALEENFRQLLSMGNLSEAEVENAKKTVLNVLESEVKAKPTRQNKALANEIVSTFVDGHVYTSPEFDVEVAKAAFEGFNAEEAKALLKSLFDGAKVKVFVSDRECPSGESLGKAVSEAFSRAVSSKHSADKFAVEKLAFSKFGKAGVVESKNEVEGLGITQVAFENGVRLNVKRTNFAKDQVLMKVSFGGGLLSIPREHPEYYAAVNALVFGGTKFQSSGEIAAALYAMKVNIGVSVSGNFFAVSGSSTSKDFPSMLKYAATMLADPGFREDGIDSLRKNAEAFYLAIKTDPRAQLEFVLPRMTESNFSGVPGTFEEFKKIRMADIAEWLKPALGTSYMEISVVGDVDPSEVERLVGESFGALPPRETTKPGGAFAEVKFGPAGARFDSSYESTDEPLSISGIMWPSCGRQDISRMRAANVLGAVLDDMLRKDVREKEGKVYSPYAYNNSSVWIKNVGFICALTAVAAEFNAQIGELMESVGAKLTSGISQDQFERAKIPLVKSVEANLRKNSYWLGAVLDLCQLNPENLEMARTIKDGYNSVSIEDVRALANEYLSKKPYAFSIMPKKPIAHAK